eukprot:6996119-Pyramimonas_sp.AAC.1
MARVPVVGPCLVEGVGPIRGVDLVLAALPVALGLCGGFAKEMGAPACLLLAPLAVVGLPAL